MDSGAMAEQFLAGMGLHQGGEGGEGGGGSDGEGAGEGAGPAAEVEGSRRDGLVQQ